MVKFQEINTFRDGKCSLSAISLISFRFEGYCCKSAALLFLHGESHKITLTVPLSFYYNQKYPVFPVVFFKIGGIRPFLFLTSQVNGAKQLYLVTERENANFLKIFSSL